MNILKISGSGYNKKIIPRLLGHRVKGEIMGSSIEAIQNILQKTVPRKGPLKKDDEEWRLWLISAIRSLVVRFHPEKVVLFGSRGNGTYTRRSDVDLAIVTETNLPFTERSIPFALFLKDSPLPIDILVFTPSEWSMERNNKFIVRIKREGVFLYERE